MFKRINDACSCVHSIAGRPCYMQTPRPVEVTFPRLGIYSLCTHREEIETKLVQCRVSFSMEKFLVYHCARRMYNSLEVTGNSGNKIKTHM